mmetsp:Transcript_151843/g.265269  ORF Transcript_151843/g.265269 Transcript_151843/m.265269 type:complete len:258 (+) Transcript_151843:679-1452(+)
MAKVRLRLLRLGELIGALRPQWSAVENDLWQVGSEGDGALHDGGQRDTCRDRDPGHGNEVVLLVVHLDQDGVRTLGEVQTHYVFVHVRLSQPADRPTLRRILHPDDPVPVRLQATLGHPAFQVHVQDLPCAQEPPFDVVPQQRAAQEAALPPPVIRVDGHLTNRPLLGAVHVDEDALPLAMRHQVSELGDVLSKGDAVSGDDVVEEGHDPCLGCRGPRHQLRDLEAVHHRMRRGFCPDDGLCGHCGEERQRVQGGVH